MRYVQDIFIARFDDSKGRDEGGKLIRSICNAIADAEDGIETSIDMITLPDGRTAWRTTVRKSGATISQCKKVLGRVRSRFFAIAIERGFSLFHESTMKDMEAERPDRIIISFPLHRSPERWHQRLPSG